MSMRCVDKCTLTKFDRIVIHINQGCVLCARSVINLFAGPKHATHDDLECWQRANLREASELVSERINYTLAKKCACARKGIVYVLVLASPF